jgi:hypothetical protein
LTALKGSLGFVDYRGECGFVMYSQVSQYPSVYTDIGFFQSGD